MLAFDKPPATWTSEDLQSLCDESAREGPSLEFKCLLSLNSDGDKKEVERDAIGIANAGGGIIVYGLRECKLEDGSTSAGSIEPLTDGALVERLNSVLDSRGDPRLPFELHRIQVEGGYCLMLEVFGHRRPHQAEDGRFHLRVNLLVRRMDESEVAEAYLDRFRRNHSADRQLFDGNTGMNPLEAANNRAHRGLFENELAQYVSDGGSESGPGWLSVVVGANPLAPGLIDPLDVTVNDLYDADFGRQNASLWNRRESPLRHYQMERQVDGFHARIPARDDVAPSYVVNVWNDGLMEFGTALDRNYSAQFSNNSMIPSRAVAEYAHDFAALFLDILARFEHFGPVQARIGIYNSSDQVLAIPAGYYYPQLRPLGTDCLESETLEGSLTEAKNQLDAWVKRFTDRLFLAGGAGNRAPYFDENGSYVSG